MQAITAVGLDVAKSDFQVHGIDSHGSIVIRRLLEKAGWRPAGSYYPDNRLMGVVEGICS